jgi:chromosomal replication initiator protein
LTRAPPAVVFRQFGLARHGGGARSAGVQDVVKDDSDRLSALRTELRRQLGDERFALWFDSGARLSLQQSVLHVVAASTAEMHWLRRKLHQTLVECCAKAWGAAPAIVYERADDAMARGDAPPQSTEVAPSRPPAGPATGRPSLRSFADYVVGSCNRLAVQAAHDVARQPGRFTPLVLCGPVGSGKTHLLRAIEQAARSAPARIRALALTAEQFTSQFVEALDRRALPGFRHKARSVDFLLIDDVQFFHGKRATFEELLHTIDALHGRGGQIVLTSDAPVAEWPPGCADLAHRVAAGLAVALETPDYLTRLGIVGALARRMSVELDHAVVELIARQIAGSARLLSGAINRLAAVGMAVGKPVTVELAEATLAEFCRQHVPPVRLADIQRAVCEVFGVESASLRSSSKTRSVAGPRMLAMWLARRYTRAALSEIGDYFGGRSHSTVVSAKRKLDDLITSGGEIVVGDRACHVEDAVRRIEAALRAG